MCWNEGKGKLNKQTLILSRKRVIPKLETDRYPKLQEKNQWLPALFQLNETLSDFKH